MNKIVTTIKNMSLFQKIQLISSIVPLYSFIFVFIVSYISCSKRKKGFFSLLVCAFIYFGVLVILLNTLSAPNLVILKYAICLVVSIIGNYFLVLNQMSKK